jgi:hypothetical protein
MAKHYDDDEAEEVDEEEAELEEIEEEEPEEEEEEEEEEDRGRKRKYKVYFLSQPPGFLKISCICGINFTIAFPFCCVTILFVASL